MATAGAILGLRVPGVEIEDIGTTAKTLPGLRNAVGTMLAPAHRARGRLLSRRVGTTNPMSGYARARFVAPRTKTRPRAHRRRGGMVVSVDRGRWGCVLGGDPDRPIVAMRARELGRTPIVVGDQVDVVGDLSGKPDTLARIVRVAARSTVLRRTADDTDPFERIVVANAQQLLIVVALPTRRRAPDSSSGRWSPRMSAGWNPILC